MSIRSLPYKKDSDLVDEAQEDVLRNRQDDEPDNGGVNMTFPPTLVNKDDDSFHLSHEAYKLLYISLPSVAVQLSVRTVFPQTASVIGRTLGTRELAAFSLASLTANLTCQSIIMGALTAAETLMPRAYGQERYREVGLLAIRGLIVSTVLLLPPIVFLCSGMEWLFQRLGQDPESSKLASEWIRIYLLAIPSFLMFRVVQAFLNAQHVVLPLVFGSFVACIVIHPILLKLIVPLLGLTGSGLCIAITQFGMISWVMLYLKVRPEHHSQSWPGLSRDVLLLEAFQPGPLCVFVTLSLGGVLSLSEWWFWETTCLIVGSFGIVPLAIHSIAYNVIPMVFMGAVGLATGLAVRIGQELSSNVQRAKSIADWCMGFAIVVGSVVATLLFWLRGYIVRIFTNDEQVIQGCMDIWGQVCVFVCILYIFSINRAILRALGMQWRIAACVVTCLWCCALPLIIYKAIYLNEGLNVIWTILPTVYAMMQVVLMLSYTRMDWNVVCNERTCVEESDSTITEAKDLEMEYLNR